MKRAFIALCKSLLAVSLASFTTMMAFFMIAQQPRGRLIMIAALAVIAAMMAYHSLQQRFLERTSKESTLRTVTIFFLLLLLVIAKQLMLGTAFGEEAGIIGNYYGAALFLFFIYAYLCFNAGISSKDIKERDKNYEELRKENHHQ